MSFTGFPVAALDFYDDLEVDNTKQFWAAHKHVYDECVRAPMVALTDELAAEFGPAKIFRPYRDVRFRADKTPYKTHQGAFVAVAEATGWYVEISPRGVMLAGGFYHASPPRLAAYRAAAAHDTYGAELERVVGSLRTRGLEVGGDRLKTKPRGYDVDHPRIDLLRHRSLTVSRSLGFEQVIHEPGLVDVVRTEWRRMRPLVEWAARHLQA